MIPQAIKDVLEVANNLIVVFTILGVGLGWYMTRQKRQDAGKLAVDQINKMATNDLPHLTKAAEESNVHLVKQTELLTSVDKSLAILVDRSH